MSTEALQEEKNSKDINELYTIFAESCYCFACCYLCVKCSSIVIISIFFLSPFLLFLPIIQNLNKKKYNQITFAINVYLL